ncbi:MAG TPA: metal-dependent transcriptional regulator [bacterium]|nr:metal-dependent transcriptional regulator [bacterium]
MEVKLSPTLRGYVTAIYKLQRKTGWASTGEVARHLGVTDAAVTQMVRRMGHSHLVRHRAYRGVCLTEKGQRIAIEMIRHHRLLETFFYKIVGMPWDQVHAEAERLQAYISPELESRIDALLGFPQFDPHGSPIPSADGVMPEVTYHPLHDVAAVGERFIFARVSDLDPRLLRYLDSLPLKLGTELTVEEMMPFDGPITVSDGARRFALSREVARHLFVVNAKPEPAAAPTSTA